MNKYRILLEVLCELCWGSGKNNEDECADCEGTGYQHEHKTIKEFKELLKEEE